MSQKPEAPRLADQLKERYGATVPTSQAAAELRRQHALNQELLTALRKAAVCLAAVCNHAPELGADETYAAVDDAIAKATK